MSYQALELNGSGFASIADGSQAGLDMGLSDFMIEVRIKGPTDGIIQEIFRKLGASGHYIVRLVSTGVIEARLNDGSATPQSQGQTVIRDGRWHYLVLVVDRSSVTGLELFVDGAEESYNRQDDITGLGDLNNDGPLLVGAGSFAPSLPFTGLIDEAHILNFGYGGLPFDYAAYITWRAAGRNISLDISNFDSGAWNGYADADRSDLTTNGDMEADSIWTARGTPTTEEQSTDQKNGGSNSWKIISDAAGEGAYQDITTVVGKYYEVTGYIYVTAGDAKLGKENTDGSDQVLTGQATAAAWTEFNVIFLAYETTSRIFFQSDATAASTFYVDDVSVKRTGLVARYKLNGDYTDETTNSNDLTAGGSGNTFPGYSLRHKGQKILLGVG